MEPDPPFGIRGRQCARSWSHPGLDACRLQLVDAGSGQAYRDAAQSDMGIWLARDTAHLPARQGDGFREDFDSCRTCGKAPGRSGQHPSIHQRPIVF